MNRLCRYVVLAMCACNLNGVARASSACPSEQKITDTDAVKIAEKELIRRDPDFDPSKYRFVDKKDKCELRVILHQKDSNRFGAGGVVILDGSGRIKRYIGGF